MRALVPAVFVLIWSTSFLVARGVVPHADPFFFLGLRFALAAAAFAVAAGVAGVAWPRGARRMISLMRRGEATRTAALMLAVLQGWAIFGETLLPVQLAGFALAIGGVALARRL